MLLPVLFSFDLFGVLDAYPVMVLYEIFFFICFESCHRLFAVGDGLLRLGKLDCLVVVHSLVVWLCYFLSPLKSLH